MVQLGQDFQGEGPPPRQGISVLPGLGEDVWVGLAVVSHDDTQLTRAAFRAWEMAGTAALPGVPPL